MENNKKEVLFLNNTSFLFYYNNLGKNTLAKLKNKKNPKTSVLIITHYRRLLDYIKPDFVHKMMDGHIVETGDVSLAYEIDKSGYGENDA